MKDDTTGKSAAIHEMLADKKNLDLDKVAQLASADSDLLNTILKGLIARNETYRESCSRVLSQIGETQPLLLYPQWDYFVELLESTNAYHRMSSINLIANLTGIDTEKKFESIFDRYFGLLDDVSMIVATYVARNAWKIVKSKPDLEEAITDRLLDIDSTHHDQERIDLIKAYIIQSFAQFFEVSRDKEKLLAFVETQLECTSPKTRKIAKGFLDQYG